MNWEILGWWSLSWLFSTSEDFDWPALRSFLLPILEGPGSGILGVMVLSARIPSLSLANSASCLAFYSSAVTIRANSPMLLSFLILVIFLHSLTRMRISRIGSHGQKWSRSLKQIYWISSNRQTYLFYRSCLPCEWKFVSFKVRCTIFPASFSFAILETRFLASSLILF